MYSKNDYRYYLEHRLAESDDFLAHYGVKGMKWKQHLKKKFNSTFDTWNSKYSDTTGELGGENTSTYKGISSKKNPNRFIQVNNNKYKNGAKETNILVPHVSKTKKRIYKRVGRVTFDGGDYENTDGARISIDRSSRKRYKKNTKKRTVNSINSIGNETRWTAQYAARNTTKK